MMYELKFYRHKDYKDLFLKRNNCCGGNANTAFYDVTRDVLEAIRSLQAYGGDFLKWLKSFPETKTKATLYKEAEFDGFKGQLTKQVWLNVADFELVILREVSE